MAADSVPSPPAESTCAATARGEQQRDVARLQRIARTVLAIALVLLGLYTLGNFLPAIAWAVVFAIATWPLYQRCAARFGTGGNIALPLVFSAAVGLVFIIPLSLVALEAGREAHGLIAWVNQARHQGLPVPGAVHHLPFGREAVASWWSEHLSDPDDASDLLDRMNEGGLLALSRNIGTQLAHRGTLFLFTLVTLFFLFREGDSITAQMRIASRRLFGPRGETIARQVVASIHGTVDGLVLVGLGEGVLLGIAYILAGIPHPALLGAVSAVAAMIPLGVIVALGIACLFALAKGMVAVAIGLGAFGLLVVFVADHFIRPTLIGGATRLPFLWVLLGILGGVESWGLLGLFVGPAVMAVLMQLWRDFTGRGFET